MLQTRAQACGWAVSQKIFFLNSQPVINGEDVRTEAQNDPFPPSVCHGGLSPVAIIISGTSPGGWTVNLRQSLPVTVAYEGSEAPLDLPAFDVVQETDLHVHQERQQSHL